MNISELDEEIEKRITQMEEEKYEFPERFSKKDYIITIVVVIICLILVISGAFF